MLLRLFFWVKNNFSAFRLEVNEQIVHHEMDKIFHF